MLSFNLSLLSQSVTNNVLRQEEGEEGGAQKKDL